MVLLESTPRARGLRTFLGVAACATLGLTSACLRPPPRPAPGAAAYVLTSVAGEPLPALLLENEIGRRFVIADTIWLNRRGSGTRHVVTRWETSAPHDAPSHQDTREAFRYRIASGRIEIEFRCGGLLLLALCAAPPHGIGQLTNDELLLTYFISARPPLLYRRLR